MGLGFNGDDVIIKIGVDMKELKSDLKTLQDVVAKSFEKMEQEANENAEQMQSHFEENFKQMKNEAKNATSSMNKSISGLSKGIRGGFSSALRGVGTMVATAFSVHKITQFGKSIVESAADLEAMEAAFEQVFVDKSGKYMDEATNRMKKMCKDWDMELNTLKGDYTSFASQFKGLGMDMSESMDASDKAMRLAADAAAMFNKPMDEAIEKVRSFVKGNYIGGESIQLFGSQTMLAAYAVETGVISEAAAFKELTEAQKQNIRLDYATHQYKLAGVTGQAARESQMYQNQLTKLTRKWEDFKAALGQKALVGITDVFKELSSVMDSINIKEFSEFFGKAVGGIGTEMSKGLKVVVEYLNGLDWSSIAKNAGELWECLKQFTGGLFDGLSAVLAPICENFVDLWEALSGSDKVDPDHMDNVNRALVNLKPLLQWFADNGEAIGKGLGYVAQGFIAWKSFKITATIGIFIADALAEIAKVGFASWLGSTLGVSGLATAAGGLLLPLSLLVAVSVVVAMNWDKVKKQWEKDWADIERWSTYVIDNVKAQWEKDTTDMENWATTVWTNIKAQWEKDTGELESLCKTVGQRVKDQWNKDVEQITNTELWKRVSAQWEEDMEFLVPLAKETGKKVKDQWNKDVAEIEAMGKTVWQRVKDQWAKDKEELITLGKQIGSNVKEQWNQDVSDIERLGKFVWGKVKDQWNKDMAELSEICAPYWAKISAQWESDTSDIEKWSSALGKKIKDQWDSDVDDIVSCCKSLWGKVKEAWDTEGQSVEDSSKSIGQKIKDQWDTDVQDIKDLVTPIWDDITSQWDEDTTFLSGIWDNICKQWEEDTESLKSMCATFKEEVGKIMDDPDYLITLIEGWTESLNTWSETTWSNLCTEFEGMKTNVTNWFTEKKDTITNGFLEWWNGVGEWFSTVKEEIPVKLEEWKTTITNWFIEKWNTFSQGFTEWWKGVDIWYEEKKQALTEKLEGWKTTIANWFIEKWNTFTEGLSEWWKNSSKWFTEKKEEFPKKLDEWKTAIGDWFVEKWTTFTDGFKEWWKNTSEWFTTQREEFPKKLDGWKEAIGNWFTSKWDTFVTGFKGWMKNVRDYFDGDGKKESEETGKKTGNSVLEGFEKKTKEPGFILRLGNAILKLLGAALLAVLVGIVAIGYSLVVNIGSGISKAWKWLKKKFEEEWLPKIEEWFSDTWDNVVEEAKKLPGRIGKAISDPKKVRDGIKNLLNDGIANFETGLNALISGANWLWDKLGGKKDKFSKITVPRLARGTDNWQGGTAIVGEAGRELVHDPKLGGTFLVNEATLLPLSKGAVVLRNSKTEKLLKNMGVPAYAKGKDENWFTKGWNAVKELGAKVYNGAKKAVKKVVKKVTTTVSNIWEYMSKPKELIKKVFSTITSGGNDVGMFDGLFTSLRDKLTSGDLVSWVTGWFKEAMPDTANIKGVEGWIPLVHKAAAFFGDTLTSNELARVLQQIKTESGGSQTIKQSDAVVDVNSLSGNHARGLLQYVPSTFADYKVSGFGNINNGYHQLLAFFNNSTWRKALPKMGEIRGWTPRGSRRKAANGILVDGATPLTVGEKGQEAVVPLSNARALKPFGQSVVNALHEEVGTSNNGGVYEFTIPVIVDGRQIAVATATYTKEELDKLEKRQDRRKGIR